MSEEPPHFEVLVEDDSTRVAVEMLVPNIRPGASCRVYPHQGKDQLLKRLPARLKSYARMLDQQHNLRVVVLVDRDRQDCLRLKADLVGIGHQQRVPDGRVINRIVVEELEAWFLGDWEAVRAAFPRAPRTSSIRNPDVLVGTWERLESLLQRGGYYQGGLRKVEAAGRIAYHMDPTRNVSPSFRAFRDAIARA